MKRIVLPAVVVAALSFPPFAAAAAPVAAATSHQTLTILDSSDGHVICTMGIDIDAGRFLVTGTSNGCFYGGSNALGGTVSNSRAGGGRAFGLQLAGLNAFYVLDTTTLEWTEYDTGQSMLVLDHGTFTVAADR